MARTVAHTGGLPAAVRKPACRLDRPVRVTLGLLLLVMTLVNVVNAATRYLFGIQVIGTDEFLAYGTTWLVMLGIPLVTAQRRNLALDVFGEAAGVRATACRDAFVHVLTATVCLYAAWQSWHYIARLVAIGSRSMALGVPMAVPHAALLVGLTAVAAVSAGLFVQDIVRLVRGEGGRS